MNTRRLCCASCGLVLMFIALSPTILHAQENEKWHDFIQELVENLDSESEIENLYNDLSTLLDNPIDLNTATQAELEHYPFLSDQQIADLIAYREKHGPMVSPYELRLIRSFDYQTIAYFIPFIVVEPPKKSTRLSDHVKAWSGGKHELLIRGDYTVEQRKGFAPITPEELEKKPNSRYLGEDFYHYVKYNYTAGEKLQAGLLAEKDRGEPLFTHSPRGYDFYSAHVVVRDLGILHTLAAGHYRASFGQGLILNSDFSFGKSSLASTIYKRATGIKRHSSTDENNYLQGAAATIRLHNEILLTALYSIKSLDGIGNDSCVTSIKTDGLHNLVREEAKRNALTMQTAGANLEWRSSWIKLALTGLYYSFSKPLLPTERYYNLNYFRGKENYNLGVSYEALRWGIKLFGETALSQSGGVATLNGVQYSPISTLQLSLLQRYYGSAYHAYYANAFRESSQAMDEGGIYAAFRWGIHQRWTLSGYIDAYRFYTPHYGINDPASGFDYQLVANYIPSTQADLTIQYRHKQKPKNYRATAKEEYRVVGTTHDRVKIQGRIRFTPDLTSKTTLEGVLYHDGGDNDKQQGWMIGEQMSWNFGNKRFQIDLFGGYFHTDDYWSRVYSTEKSMLYTFYTPSFYGNGFRLALNAKAQVSPTVVLYLKYGRSQYSDRETIGSDLDEIPGNTRNDLNLLMKWRF